MISDFHNHSLQHVHAVIFMSIPAYLKLLSVIYPFP